MPTAFNYKPTSTPAAHKPRSCVPCGLPRPTSPTALAVQCAHYGCKQPQTSAPHEFHSLGYTGRHAMRCWCSIKTVSSSIQHTHSQSHTPTIASSTICPDAAPDSMT